MRCSPLLLIVILVFLCLVQFRVAATVSKLLLSPYEPQPQPRFRLHNLFSGNMTLARSPQQAVMWGIGAAGATILVKVDGVKSGSSQVDETGNWTVTLTAHDAAVNTTVSVTDGETELILYNVAFGDIFFCSGQSNMQMPLDYSFGSADEIAWGGNFTNVRLFSMAGNQYSSNPIYESRLSYSNGWVLPSPKTLQYAPGDLYNYFSGVCWYTGKDIYQKINAGKNESDIIPIGLIQGAYAGAGVIPFISSDSAQNCGYIPPSPQPTQQPTVIYNAMVYPYLKLRISAVLWYQGESDTGNTTLYSCTFPTLIKDWRTRWQLPNLPFYFVMLHPYNGGQGLADIRFVQMSALALPNTAIAAAIDLGDLGGPAGQIHPRNKSYVGVRLSLLAQAEMYGMKVITSGPSVDFNAKSPIIVTVTPGNPNSVQIVMQFGADDNNAGLYELQTPNCTSCCTNMQNLANIRLLNESGNTQYNPTFSVDAKARQVSLIFNTTALPKVGQLVQISMSDVQWPQCLLYNSAKLPAFPMRVNVAVSGTMTGDHYSPSSPF